ncbi:histidine kinase N-terminal 7TM domain-containing protein [Halorientalis halophila]|uniref:histidine kinase N-terminal 7TM domain-containing protein n=1 Tax=Halorientalis halophila TaxID=3108499 RepID=UPI0030090ED6
MFPGPELYAAVLFLTVLPAAYLIRAVWSRLDRPSGRWLVVTLVGMSGWSVSWALMLLFEGYRLSLWSFNVVVLFASVTTIGWLFVTIEYTWQKQVEHRIVAPFLIVPAVVQVLIWTNPFHELVWRPGTFVDAQGVLHPVHGLGFYLHIGYSYLLVVAGLVLLTVAFVEREGLYRKQAFLLLLGGFIPTVFPIAFVFGMIPTDYLNPTPLGFLLGTSIWGWALFRYQLLKTVPVARRMVLAEMSEGVLIVDDGNVVTDANDALHEMFDLESDPTGKPLESVLEPYEGLRSLIQSGTFSDERITVELNGEPRHLTVSKSSVTHDGGTGGWVLVFNDRTALFRYEEDLELLKGVLARVLRHDIRNKLNVIRAHGELLAQQTDGQHAKQARTVVQTSDAVIETAEKAKAIESLVEADRPLYDTDLVHVAGRTVDWATEQYPDVDIEFDAPDQAWVRADERLALGIRSLVENGIEHNDSDAPMVRVAIERTDDTVTLTVDDNGSGIDRYEQRVFEGEAVDQLNHSTGLGLWLVNWVVRNSNGATTVTQTETGTRFVVTLERRFPSESRAVDACESEPGSR